jgi:nucleoside-diphosphate-sugar epimerase
MKRVLLTGASGFIGRHCLPLLLDKEYEVHALSSRAIPEAGPPVFWHRADLLDPDGPARLLDRLRPSHLLHFAWITEPGAYWTSPGNPRWAEASLALLRSFTEHGGRRAVVAGSCAEYDWRSERCFESDAPSPSTPYGSSKHSLHLQIEDLCREARVSSAWGRIFFVYGPHEKPERFVPSLIRALLGGERAVCHHADQTRDLLHVRDVAHAFVTLLESPAMGAVNIASGIPVALGGLARAIAGKIDRPDLLECRSEPAVPISPRAVVADVRRMTKEVGWSPQYDLDRGLEETIDWWRKRAGSHA